MGGLTLAGTSWLKFCINSVVTSVLQAEKLQSQNSENRIIEEHQSLFSSPNEAWGQGQGPSGHFPRAESANN